MCGVGVGVVVGAGEEDCGAGASSCWRRAMADAEVSQSMAGQSNETERCEVMDRLHKSERRGLEGVA